MSIAKAVTGILLLFAFASAHADVEIITLRHRTLDEVIPVLRPLLEKNGSISGTNDKLVIRASRANIAELRKVVASIDVAPRRLVIHVRQDSGGGPDGRDSGARVYDSRSASEVRVEQRIQALEGTAATIQIGLSIPVTTRTVTQGPGGAIVSDSVAYRDVTTGFEVVPRIAGERVVLDISPRRDTPASGGAINVQRLASTASGRLGEWFELGRSGPGESRQGEGVVAGTSALRQDVRRVWVKVEELK